MTYTVRLGPEVALQIDRIVSWWEANRPENPNLLETELIAMLSTLATFPYRGSPVPRSRPQSGRRRVLVPRTEYRITYDIVENTREVVIIRISSSRRRR